MSVSYQIKESKRKSPELKSRRETATTMYLLGCAIEPSKMGRFKFSTYEYARQT